MPVAVTSPWLDVPGFGRFQRIAVGADQMLPESNLVTCGGGSDPSWATTCPRASRPLADQWFHGSRGAKLRTTVSRPH